VAFPSDAQYKGHFKEDGYNGIFFSRMSNCFARNVHIRNSGKKRLMAMICHCNSTLFVLVVFKRRHLLLPGRADSPMHIAALIELLDTSAVGSKVS
jgi:hypothetical protein